MAKISSKIFRHFWQLSNFIANISGTDQHIEHLRKLDQPQPLPKWTFLGDYISSIRGCCPLKFFIPVRDWPRLLSAHLFWDRGSPKKLLSRKLKIGPKIQRMRLNNFRAGGNIFMKLLQTTCRETMVIICVQLLEGLPPEIWEDQKLPNFSAFSDNFRLWSRLSPERIYLSNIWKKTWSTAFPSALNKRKLVNFGGGKF